MLDPKFEKEVQQKMEGLEFSPSDEVWVNLQRELHKEKRRRAPLMWLFFLLGGMLLGAGGASLFFFYGSSSRRPLAETNNSAAINSAAITGNAVVPHTDAANNNSAAINGDAARTHTTVGIDDPGKSGLHAAVNDPGKISGSGKTNGSAEKNIAGRQYVFGETNSAAEKNGISRKNASGVSTAKGDGRPGGSERVEVNAMLAGTETGSLGDPAADLNRIRLSAISRTASTLSSDKLLGSKARLTLKPFWEAGFTGGAGISSVSMPQAPASVVSLLPAFPQVSSLAARAAGRVSAQPSRMRPDLSYWAGIFVQRPLFKKLTLAVGLNLHYYSTRMEIGQKVVDNPSTNATLFYLSTYTQPAAPSYPSYSAGYNTEYTNRYYFLEVPVSLQWQFNRSRKIPLFWEGGLSFSRLMSADALYFDEKSRLYYKDGQVANPTQFMAFSSLMVGLSWRGNLIQVGPEGQYGLGSLLNTNSTGSQHLFYGGIRLVVIPRKW